MSYFSRLTDIVTCSLTRILAEVDDPKQAIVEIIAEMEEGLAGAKRSVATAQKNEDRLKQELEEHQTKIGYWTTKAKDELGAGQEDQARLALIRKREVEDLIAGLEQQSTAATATREHLTTMQRALEARLAEALRKQQELLTGESGDEATAAPQSVSSVTAAVDVSRSEQIDAELEALKRELGKDG